MKKILLLILVSVLLLSGCAVYDEADDTTTIQTEPPGYYVSASEIEQQTGGAVRRYDLPESGYRWISAIGDQILLASDGETANLSVLTGADCVNSATIQLNSEVIAGKCCVFHNGFAYYDETEKQVVFLDQQLHEVNRIVMPEEIQGVPVFSAKGDKIFYCIGQEIHVFEIERKISRLIKAHSYQNLKLIETYFDGEILACAFDADQGRTSVAYISTQDGRTLKSDDSVKALDTYDNNYFAQRMDGLVRQLIIGNLDGSVKNLNLQDDMVASALPIGGVVACSSGENGVLNLAFYDISSGTKTSEVKLENVSAPEAFYADRWTGCMWMLSTDTQSGGKILLRWDVKKTTIEDETVYTGTLYTADKPNKELLKQCSSRVSALNKAYGVRIRIWNDAVKYPTSYHLVAEHQPDLINEMLDTIESVLQEFPDKFIKKSASSQIRICIVRSVDAEIKAVNYWDTKTPYIVLSAGVDVRSEFLRCLAYVVDTHVLGNSAMYDHWGNLNPEGFVYGTPDSKYLEGDSRAFVNETSMASPTEDRSNILHQAMLPDNQEMFRSETMQKKLLTICKAIRNAWGLSRKEEAYFWEQYLTEPIAYKK